MAGKTVWIVGGLVVALGVVAYLSYHTAPAGKDAAGTIVEAKRAISDGASGPATSSGASGDRSADSDASQGDSRANEVRANEARVSLARLGQFIRAKAAIALPQVEKV